MNIASSVVITFLTFAALLQGAVAFNELKNKTGHPKIWLTSTVVCIVLAVISGYTSYASPSTSPSPQSNTTTPNTISSLTATDGTTPTVAPTSSPTPTTPCPKPCIVYQENGSDGWQDWSLASGWRIVDNNKLLSNDGSVGSQVGPSAIPPYSLPQGIQNFAIEVGITAPQGLYGTGGAWDGHISITACGSTTSNDWQGYEALIGYNMVPWSKADILTNQDQLAQTDFSPNTGLYTYRLEVKGNVISLFVKGGLVVQGIDNKFLPCGSQIGIASSHEVIHVSSFKVILL